jgi:catechol 2,3-dioxygenase-like lactoylglutathione lyase family enzyme
MKLEVVVIGVSDVDRAKAFYENLGWRLDADFATGDEFCVVQLTPYLSARQNGSSPEEAAAADRYMEEVRHVLPR